MQNNSITEFFYNTEFNVIDIKTSTDLSKFSVSDYILSLLLHNSLKSFDGGETFTGSIMEEFSVDNNKQYQGNLRAVINNASIGDESNQAIIDEIKSCLKPGIDDGIFSLTSQDNIILKFKESHCYITINIIINKKRESLIFYYDKGINTIKLTSKR